jgi:glucokinase
MTLGAGVDIGGTKIAACIADVATGRVVSYDRVPSSASAGGQAVLGTAVSLVKRVATGFPVESVGVGICELVDLSGRVSSSYTVDWRQLDATAAFSELAPARFESDVRAAALAEARFGRARGLMTPWLYLSVGTGISYCLVIAGEPYAGAHGNALLVGAPMVEMISSGLALERAAGRGSAEEVLSDETSADLVAHATRSLGLAMATLVNALDPALVVVGGGLGLEASYRDAAVKVMRATVELPSARDLPVLPAELADAGGAIGAALVGAAR